MKHSSRYINKDVLRQFFILSSILAAFAINVFANIAPPNGLTIGEIANTIFREVLITPANYAFAIWGIIYLALISLGIYQALPKERQNQTLRQMGYLLVISSVAQIGWVFLFQHRLFVLSLVAMLAILLPLTTIYQRLGIGLERVSKKDKWFVHIPISIYFGWISVATIVNVASVLYYLNWTGWGISPESWTVIALIIAAAIAATITIQRHDIAYPLVIVWALIAIAVRHTNNLLIAGTAGGLAIVLVLLVLWRVLRRS